MGGVQASEGAYDEFLTANVVCHHMALQWFGGYVSPSSWANYAVADGVAGVLAYQCMEKARPHMNGRALFQLATSPMGAGLPRSRPRIAPPHRARFCGPPGPYQNGRRLPPKFRAYIALPHPAAVMLSCLDVGVFKLQARLSVCTRLDRRATTWQGLRSDAPQHWRSLQWRIRGSEQNNALRARLPDASL